MTHLDSMTRRHAAGQPLTAEEVRLLLDYAGGLLAGVDDWDEINRSTDAAMKLTAFAPQPEQKVCKWAEHERCWRSSCGIDALDNPLSYGSPVCQCGLPIREVKP